MITTTQIESPKGQIDPLAIPIFNLAHLKLMTCEHGIWQHSQLTKPDYIRGFSIDDEARGLIVALGLIRHGIEIEFAEQLADVCFRFIEKASLPDGRFHNFADEYGRWIDPFGSDDSFGRTLWALGVAWTQNHPMAPRDRISPLLDLAVPRVSRLKPVRSLAFSVLGISRLGSKHTGLVGRLADQLMDALWEQSGPRWYWFEPVMTYCNARLPQALLVASQVLSEKEEYKKAGIKSLDFLMQSMRKVGGGKTYAPIGNQGWYKKGSDAPAMFAQQPVEAGALAEACLMAAQQTGQPKYRSAAYEALAWYDGRNAVDTPLVDPESGGIYDGVFEDGINHNMGAESILSYLMAHIALRDSVPSAPPHSGQLP